MTRIARNMVTALACTLLILLVFGCDGSGKTWGHGTKKKYVPPPAHKQKPAYDHKTGLTRPPAGAKQKHSDGPSHDSAKKKSPYEDSQKKH